MDAPTSDPSEIVGRIEREAGVPDLAGRLAALAPTDLQSLLLEVRRRARARRPADVLADQGRDPFVRPATVAPARLLAWEAAVLDALPADVETLALAPLCPLGTSAVVAGVTQDWAVATDRNTEVVSDATNVLALEAALRRRALLRDDPRSPAEVHLAAAHRLLRPQRFRGADQVQHFHLAGLVGAGRARAGLSFELGALERHLRALLTALRAFVGADAPLEVSLTDLDGGTAGDAGREARLDEGLLAPLRAAFPWADAGFDRERVRGRGYYRGLCFHVHARLPDGTRSQLADGGLVDWSQRLLSNAKERMAIAGIGGERVVATADAWASRP